jgi:hypothetical protein
VVIDTKNLPLPIKWEAVGTQRLSGSFGTKGKYLALVRNQNTIPSFCLPRNVITLLQIHSLKHNKNNPAAGLCNIGSFHSTCALDAGLLLIDLRCFEEKQSPFPRTRYSQQKEYFLKIEGEGVKYTLHVGNQQTRCSV